MATQVWLLVGVAVGAATALAAALAVCRLLGARTHWGGPCEIDPCVPDDQSPPDLAELRNRLNDVSRAISDAASLLASGASRLAGSQARLEEHAMATWQTAKNARTRHFRTVGDLLLLADHLESPAVGAILLAEPDHPLAMVARRVGKILEDAGVIEIPVARGQPFDSSCQRTVGRRQDMTAEGTVLEVARKGYASGDAAEDFAILRPAEVIVSSGPPDPAPEKQDATEENTTEENAEPEGRRHEEQPTEEHGGE